ncbi:lipid-transfer protein [Croceicoccus sp. F390]|uniref:Lipid-transfer protein n=1 Tax=Croceicoccus esteveae TaxID=3075597 RepID=A0ABU2ZF37_9SPHN|nr:lipid-transfer protein [Croceicoccus sp. F390]MDT0575199.1 lipid-transfer protein [Croceicoccus sp. F390]
MSRKAVIAGIGQTEFSKKSGRSEQQLAAECVTAACVDAGFDPRQIDGMITFALDHSDEVDVMRSTGAQEVKYSVRLPQGGAASVTTVVHARNAVESGMCDAVVIWRAMNERSQYRFGQPSQTIDPDAHSSTFMEWCFPFGAQTPAAWEVLSCGTYLDTFGVTTEDLGRIAVILRQNAATNPLAQFYGRPITLDDHQQSRWIVKPWLRLLDCCQESDGGVALLVTTEERARDLRQKPVKVLGAEYAFCFNHEIISDFYEGDLTRLANSEAVTRRLTASAGIAPRDTDVAMIYDNFTPQILRQLEGFGYCGRGEAKEYVADGHLALDGKTPLSPNGGLLGEAYIHGMNNITEGVRQLRGTASNQIAGASTAFLASGVAGAILGV